MKVKSYFNLLLFSYNVEGIAYINEVLHNEYYSMYSELNLVHIASLN